MAAAYHFSHIACGDVVLGPLYRDSRGRRTADILALDGEPFPVIQTCSFSEAFHLCPLGLRRTGDPHLDPQLYVLIIQLQLDSPLARWFSEFDKAVLREALDASELFYHFVHPDDDNNDLGSIIEYFFRPSVADGQVTEEGDEEDLRPVLCATMKKGSTSEQILYEIGRQGNSVDVADGDVADLTPGCRVLACIRPRSLWIADGSWGINYELCRVVVQGSSVDTPTVQAGALAQTPQASSTM